MAGGVHRLIFTNQVNQYNQNRYVPGSGVGGQNISVRRHLKRFAARGGNGPCCPELLQNYGYIQK